MSVSNVFVEQIDWKQWPIRNIINDTIDIQTIPDFVIEAYRINKYLTFNKNAEVIQTKAVNWLQSTLKVDVFNNIEKWKELYFSMLIKYQKTVQTNEQNYKFILMEILYCLTFDKIARIEDAKKWNDEYIKYMEYLDVLRLKWKVGYK